MTHRVENVYLAVARVIIAIVTMMQESVADRKDPEKTSHMHLTNQNTS